MVSKYINNAYKRQTFSKYENLYLVCLILVGTIVRIIYHYNRPFIGDEVGTLIYTEKSISYILSHFESWLTMNYFILLEKIVFRLSGHNQMVLAFIPFIAGISTIPLTAILAKHFTSTKVALISATLVAMNSYLIHFSGIIRSYSLLAALSLAVIILFFNWFSNRTYKNGVYVSVASYFLVLSHLNGIYVLAYILLILCIDWFSMLARKEKSGVSTLLIPLFGSFLFMMASYIKIFSGVFAWGIPYHDVPPTNIAYIPYVFSQYFGFGFYGWPSAVLMICAALATFKYERPSLILWPYLILPIILISVQGISYFPWGYSRFLIILLPICIIFIAEEIQRFSSFLVPDNSNVFGIFLTIMLLITWGPNLQSGYETKFDYP